MMPLTPTKPHFILMVGIPGSGKTWFAEHFAKTFSAPFLNVTDIQLLTAASDKTALKLSDQLLDEFLKTKRTLVYEGPAHDVAVRTALLKKARKEGYEPLIVWVQTETGEASRRSLKDGRIQSADDYNRFLDIFNAPHDSEQAVVISGRHTYASQVKGVLKRLSTQRSSQLIRVPKRPTSPSRSRVIGR